MKDAIDDKRPWYHGPIKSDWDRKQKAKECEEGDEEACHELEDEENRWNRIIAKFVGDPIEKIILKESLRGFLIKKCLFLVWFIHLKMRNLAKLPIKSLQKN